MPSASTLIKKNSTSGKERRGIWGDSRIGEKVVQRCPGAKVEPAELRGCLGIEESDNREEADDAKDQEPNPWRCDCDNQQ
jgi:hypothetical protein